MITFLFRKKVHVHILLQVIINYKNINYNIINKHIIYNLPDNTLPHLAARLICASGCAVQGVLERCCCAHCERCCMTSSIWAAGLDWLELLGSATDCCTFCPHRANFSSILKLYILPEKIRFTVIVHFFTIKIRK